MGSAKPIKANTMSIKFHAQAGSGDTNNGTKLTDLYSSGVQHQPRAVVQLTSCTTADYKTDNESKCSLDEQKMSHFTPLYCLGIHRVFWVTYLMHRLAQPSWDGLVVLSQNASFTDKSICTLLLHRKCPLWTGLSPSFMECIPLGQVLWHTSPSWTSQQNYVPQS